MEHLTPIVFINSFSIVLRFKSINQVVNLNHLLLQEEIHVVMDVLAMVGVLPANAVLSTVGAERQRPIVVNQQLPVLEARVAMDMLAMVGVLPANVVLNTAGVEHPLPTVQEEPHAVMENAAMVSALLAIAVPSGDGVVGLWITATKLRRKPMI
jgi:hypothetical protein